MLSFLNLEIALFMNILVVKLTSINLISRAMRVAVVLIIKMTVAVNPR